MSRLKVFYLCSELKPFSESYNVASFSNRLSSVLHDKDNYGDHIHGKNVGDVSDDSYDDLLNCIKIYDSNRFLGDVKKVELIILKPSLLKISITTLIIEASSFLAPLIIFGK